MPTLSVLTCRRINICGCEDIRLAETMAIDYLRLSSLTPAFVHKMKAAIYAESGKAVRIGHSRAAVSSYNPPCHETLSRFHGGKANWFTPVKAEARQVISMARKLGVRTPALPK